MASLTRQVLDSPALTQLAETPLLCAAICYLHRIKRGEIPRRAVRLYEAICEQLVHQLDVERLEQDGYERLVPALAGLDLENKLALLSRLALAMIRAEKSSFTREAALPVIREGLDVLRKEQAPEDVLTALQERSGVLRGASEEIIEFSHNALKSHLAARRLFSVSEGEREVIRLADATSDPSLVLLTAAQAAILYRESLIEALIDLSDKDEKKKRQLQIMALRCGNDEIESDGLRERLDKLMAAVFPPRDANEAAALAELSDRALAHLEYDPNASAALTAASVSCLKRIATPAAAAKIEDFLTTTHMEVAEELAEVVHPLRIRAVVDACVNPAENNDYVVGSISTLIRDIDPLLTRDDVLVLSFQSASLNDDEIQKFAAFTKLRDVRLDNTPVTDAGIAHLSLMTSLRRISLSSTQISDAGLRYLAGLISLQYLSLDETQVTDASLCHLSGLTNLTDLSLCSTRVTSAGLRHLSRLTSLHHLYLIDTVITDVGIGHLTGLSSLQDLYVGSTQITDNGIGHLTRLTSLQTLYLGSTLITDAGLRHLSSLTSLKFLFFDDTKITAFGLHHLSGLNSLQHLSLDDTQVADTGLCHLSGLSTLQHLSLGGTTITDTGLCHLSGLTNLQHLSLGGTQITDAGLCHLSGLTSLQELSLHNTEITDAGLSHLSGLPKLLYLYLAGTKIDRLHPTLDALRERGVYVHI